MNEVYLKARICEMIEWGGVHAWSLVYTLGQEYVDIILNIVVDLRRERHIMIGNGGYLTWNRSVLRRDTDDIKKEIIRLMEGGRKLQDDWCKDVELPKW